MSEENEQGQWQYLGKMTLDGDAVVEHKIDAEAFANSLVCLNDLIKKSNIVLNKNSDVSVKVLARFHESSFKYEYILDFAGKIAPLMPHLIQCIRNLIMLKSFLHGKPPKEMAPMPDGNMNIVNSDNVSITVSGNTINLYTSQQVENSLRKLTEKLLRNGIDKVSIDTDDAQQKLIEEKELEGYPADITSDNKDFLISDDTTEQTEFEEDIVLQIVRVSFKHGEKWRFYDAENGDEFSAFIHDNEFIEGVSNSKYKFSRDTYIKAKMKTIIEKSKKKTKASWLRYITNVVEVFEQKEPSAKKDES